MYAVRSPGQCRTTYVVPCKLYTKSRSTAASFCYVAHNLSQSLDLVSLTSLTHHAAGGRNSGGVGKYFARFSSATSSEHILLKNSASLSSG